MRRWFLVTVSILLSLGGAAPLLAQEEGIVTGHVLRSDGVTPIAEIRVEAGVKESGQFVPRGTGVSDTEGRYRISLPAGSYFVRVRTSDAHEFIGEYYNDAPDLASATEVPVGAGETVDGIDFTLTAFSSISGTITSEETGLALSGIAVDVLTTDGTTLVASSEATGEDGRYLVARLPAGRYIAYTDVRGRGVIPEYYDDVLTVEEATPIPVGEEDAVTGIDFALAEEGEPSANPEALVVRGVVPDEIPNDQATDVAIQGDNFKETPTVTITDPEGETRTLEGVIFVNSRRLEATLPTGLRLGGYDLTVTNPDGESATLFDAFTVVEPAETTAPTAETTVETTVEGTTTSEAEGTTEKSATTSSGGAGGTNKTADDGGCGCSAAGGGGASLLLALLFVIAVYLAVRLHRVTLPPHKDAGGGPNDNHDHFTEGA